MPTIDLMASERNIQLLSWTHKPWARTLCPSHCISIYCMWEGGCNSDIPFSTKRLWFPLAWRMKLCQPIPLPYCRDRMLQNRVCQPNSERLMLMPWKLKGDLWDNYSCLCWEDLECHVPFGVLHFTFLKCWLENCLAYNLLKVQASDLTAVSHHGCRKMNERS